MFCMPQKRIGEVEVQFHSFLILALDEVSGQPYPGSLSPGRSPTHVEEQDVPGLQSLAQSPQ